MKIFLLTISILLALTDASAEIKYPVSAIPEELKQGVDVVIREDAMVFTIIAKDKASLYTRYVVTILNDKGNDYAHRSLGYNKLARIANLNASVYDMNGKQIKKLKDNEIYDHVAFDASTLFSDYRVKSINLEQTSYPYTIEFEYTIDYKYLYSIPTSTFGGEHSSTQVATYQLIYPKEIAPRYKVFNIEDKPVRTEKNGIESLLWTYSNIKPMKFEYMGPRREELVPMIIAGPTSFEYEGYEGNMSTWREYGKWNALLNQGRDALPEAAKQKVRELTKNLTTNEQKAKMLYEYLQGKTRYVGIQLGIGGLQPFPATVVDETGYGDCKALSNYMVALLKEAGIKGYYTTVNSGKGQTYTITEFPSHQSDHVIVAVPNGKDTLWMECTSQTKPFGYMGSFTGDRLALMITDDGGKLVRTPTYKAEQNTQIRTANVSVDALGNAKAKVKTTYKGIQSENGGLDFILGNQVDDQKKWIQENTDIPSFVLNTFSFKEVKDKIPSVVVNLDLTLNRYASVSGKRVFITPNLMNKSTFLPPKTTEQRNTDVVWNSNYLDIDSVTFNFPENLYPEFVPAPVKIASRFGEYEATYKFDEGKLVYVRRMKVEKGRFPKESYNELIDFYKGVNKSDNIKLVFLSKT